MKEKSVEQKLVSEVKKRGGICPKWVSPGYDGVPDRIALLPDGKFGFFEIKAPGKKPRSLQLARHRQLEKLGFRVFVPDGTEQIEGMLDEIEGGDAG